ncbi:SDR family NAD(P)-dependent oxidoreductase [Castellaniella sp.]|uniref:SDR family NAD(P)-dependent oxidoreductase n=1 Tax=Castellaniella sp. TaxID=1955812 RepID=UPI0035617DA6
MPDAMESLSVFARGEGFAGLADKVVVITGAASGLGRTMAHAFASCHSRLVLFDRNRSGLDTVQATLAARYADVSVRCREGLVNDPVRVQALFDELEADDGGVDVLLNNAGVSMNRPTLELGAQDWQRAIDINLNGVFYCAQAAGRLMVARGAGVIINTASMYGVVAAPNRAAYCASKAAVAMLSKALAVEWGPSGVRVNAIAPGYLHTALVDELVAQGRLDDRALARRTPSGRLGTPEEIAALVLFLASDHAAFINGHVAVADGGWSANGYL